MPKSLSEIYFEGEKEFDKKFITESSNMTKSGKRLVCDPDFAKSHIRTRTLAMIGGMEEMVELDRMRNGYHPRIDAFLAYLSQEKEKIIAKK